MPEQAIPRRSQIALIAYLFLVTASFGFLQPFLPLYLEAAGLTRTQIGLVFGLSTGIALVMQLVWGRLSDLVGARRPFVVFGGLCAAAAYFSFPHVNGAVALLLLSALGQNGILYLNTVGGVLIGSMVQRHQGGAAYAGYRVWGSVGYVVVTIASGAILNGAGGNLGRPALNGLFTTVPLIFIAIAVLAFFVPDPRAERRPEGKTPRAPLPSNLVWFLACNFLYVIALYGATNFLPLYMVEVGGTPLWVTSMFAGGVVCEILVMRQSGRLSDRFGRRPLLAFTFLLLPVRLILYPLAWNPIGVLAVQLLHGLNFGIMGAISVVLINDLTTNDTRGQAQARLAAVSGMASAVGPIVLGILAQASLRLMFTVAAAVAALAAALFLLAVAETNPNCVPLEGRGPAPLRRLLRLLDAPPRRDGR